MFFETRDGSCLDSNGKVLYFSTERFIKDICEGNCCFICGVSPSEANFNDEHILPKWILRKHNLFNQSINLPNETTFRYDQYTVPCCQLCNSLMGKKIEEPVRNLITQGFDAVAQYMKREGPQLFFVWLSLIFLKAHLKDKSLRYYRDLREKDHTIFDIYTWEELHHIHCIARSFYTNCYLDYKIIGSFLTISAKRGSHHHDFDYLDLNCSQTILLRFNDVCFITVLNDSCGSLSAFRKTFERFSRAMSPLQLREVAAHLAIINLNLKERPRFLSTFDLNQGRYVIRAHFPDFIEVNDFEKNELGEVMNFCCKDLLSICNDENIEQIKDQVKKGKLTFLFDNEGRFITNSFMPL
jgi:hypothetical protein